MIDRCCRCWSPGAGVPQRSLLRRRVPRRPGVAWSSQAGGLAFRSVPLMIFVLAFLRQNLTNYVCTQILCLYNLCIRILGSLACNIIPLSYLSLVLCCDIHRSTLISIMYPACMITVHDRKSRALHGGPAARGWGFSALLDAR